MLRFASTLLLTFLFTQILFANDFKKCHNDVKKSYKFQNSKHMYHTQYGWLYFSDKKENDVLGSEPLLGLYLLKKTVGTPTVKVLRKHPKDVVALTRAALAKNHIVNEGLGIDRLAVLKENSYIGTAIFGSCCTLRGFVTDSGLVTSEYILRFVQQKRAFASAGMRFDLIKGKIIVTSVNPFFEFNPFKQGDEILYFDGKKRSFDTLAKEILFSKVGSKHFFKVKRGSQTEGLSLYFKERLGGGVLADTYLEHFGFRLGKDMKIRFIAEGSIAMIRGLKEGDTLLSLNNNTVVSGGDVRAILQKPLTKENMRLMFERRGLAFNIYFPKQNMLTLQK